MWNPIKIEIYNLFAHKESVYDFNNNTCTVIFGRNETDRGLKNNGAGKTTLFEAICISLTNESLRTIKKDSFINKDEEDCRIIFHLYNPVLKMKLRIIRQFFRSNRPVKIEIWENDKLNKQVVSVSEANKRVFDLIGISREDLLRYFIISQDSRYTFFTANDMEKKEIMNRITSADMINPIVEEINFNYKKNNDEYNDINHELSKLIDKKKILVEQREEVLDNDDTEEELIKLSDYIHQSEKSIEEISLYLDSYNKEVKIIESKIKTIESKIIDTNELKKDRKKLEENIEILLSEIYENKATEKKLKSELQDTIICPKCDHEFIHESEFGLSVKDTKLLLKEAQNEIKKQNKKYELLQDKLKYFKEILKSSSDTEELLRDTKREKDIYDRKIRNKQQDRDEIAKKIAKWNADKEVLKEQKKNDKLLNLIDARIGECNSEINKLNERILPISEEIEIIKFWQFNMGRSGFQTFLANKSIKILEGSTNYFLEKMKVDYRVTISTFKVLKSGEVREKIDCFISDNGMDTKNFLAYSGGERQRVTLAGILAIQRLINLSLDGRGINMLLLDESLGNIDSLGTMEIVRILEKLSITVMLITQNIEDSSIFQNSIQVIKREGISKFTFK